ncbi:MAG: hypothetical protein KKD05_03290 [Candidatus Omnitrophica bacterium]|nr:hypothetical protein [Candidatus Omnitrophota bacterium]
MLKKIRRVLILSTGVLFILSQAVFAQVNPELIKALNQVLIWDIHIMRQCESHSEQFSIFIPYNQIISEKQQSVKALSELIDFFGADINDTRIENEKSLHDYQALNLDAYAQTQGIMLYDNLLNKFGHPKVQAFAIKAKNQAYVHYMLLSTAAQQLIAARQTADIAQINQP